MAIGLVHPNALVLARDLIQPSTPHDAMICQLSKADDFPCTFCPPNIHDLMAQFETQVVIMYTTGSPRTDLLLSLSRFNVLRAAYENAVTVGMTVDWMCRDDTVSIFSIAGPQQYSETRIPASLWPTHLQRAVPHHPWLDIFPFQQMRDNLINAQDSLDDVEFCHDLTAFWDTRRTNATLLIWGNPWDPQNWEVTEAFARKWGWILRGCPEILASTNKWRIQRHEKPLVWKKVFH